MKLTQIITLLAGLFIGCASLHAAATKSIVGQAMPKLDIEYLSAKPELAGKVVIIEFWATWCPPCRQSIPHLNEVYSKFKDKGLVIIGISNEKQKDVVAFTKTLPLQYTSALDKNGLGKSLGITGIPHAILVDKGGKVVWEGHPMSLKESQIETLLKK